MEKTRLFTLDVFNIVLDGLARPIRKSVYIFEEKKRSPSMEIL
jgi:hypothetical protein